MRRRLLLLPLLLLLTSCLKQELFSGLDEKESQEIIVLLQEHGIEAVRSMVPGEGSDGLPTWTVHVKGGHQNLVLAWRILQENGLPRQRVKGMDEVFAKAGMIPTAGEEKARMLVGLTGELTKTLKSIPRVVDARVHVVIPENSPLIDRADWSPTTASVLVKHLGEDPPLSEEDVKLLVSRGVEGLGTENVAVIYHQIHPKPAPAQDVSWYLRNEQILVAALSLAVILALGSLLLIFQSRRQRAQITQLRRQLQSTVQSTQLSVETGERT